jgi:hypothetical protein
MLWRFIRVIYARKSFDLAAAGAGIKTLRVPLFTHFQRRVNEHFYVMVSANQVTYIIPGCPVRARRGANGNTSMPYNLGRYVTHTAHMIISIFLAETQSFREIRSYHIPI